ncbi:MAG: hypothetical protein PVH30_09435, partial [Desulfobacterales bacterium]
MARLLLLIGRRRFEASIHLARETMGTEDPCQPKASASGNPFRGVCRSGRRLKEGKDGDYGMG